MRTIRPEQVADAPSIFRVNPEAFGGEDEAR